MRLDQNLRDFCQLFYCLSALSRGCLPLHHPTESVSHPESEGRTGGELNWEALTQLVASVFGLWSPLKATICEGQVFHLGECK